MKQANFVDGIRKTIQVKGHYSFWKLYFFFLLVGLAALLPRLESLKYFYGKYLWAEDGNVFLNQAAELGATAVLTPYAGYLHVYPRLIAAISQSFDLIHQPTVLLAGWFGAYFILLHSLLRSIFFQKKHILYLALLPVFMALQPHYGEVFFNITNSQWLLGAALCLYVIADSEIYRSSSIRFALLFLLSLTGPFSVVLIPILIVKLILRRDWLECKWIYLTIFLGSIIQLTTLLSSDRVTSGAINNNPWEWAVSFLKILFFGPNDVLTFFSAFSIWAIILYLIFSNIYKERGLDTHTQTALLLLITAFLLIVAGLFSHKANPSAIVALGGGNRYTWVPYVLILTSVTLLIDSRKLLGALLCSFFAFICYANFHKALSPNLQFESFAKFSEVDNVTIPINPQWPTYPGWHVAAKRLTNPLMSSRVEIVLSPESVSFSGMDINFSIESLEVNATNADPIIFLLDEISCPLYSHAGLNIYLNRANEGWLQLFWSATKNYNEIQSLRRWYPSGDIKAQFAFPLNNGKTHIRIDPMETLGSAKVKKIELYCLK